MHIRSTDSPSPYPYQPLPSEDWRESVARISPSELSHESNALVRRLVKNSNYIPTQAELNPLIVDCMFRGRVEALNNMLAQLPLDTLNLTRPTDERAWQTLLKAMPASCPIQQVILFGQQFDEASTLGLFQALGGMPDLHSVRLEWCKVTFQALINPPSCPPLLEMRNLYFKNTDNAEILLFGILKASPNLGKLYLDSNAGIDDKKHLLFTETLVDSHASTLHTLTVRALRHEKCVAHYTALMKKSTALANLDLSANNLSSSTCRLLKDAALNARTGLTSLSLAECWPHMPVGNFDWEPLAGLVSLKSLIRLDLSSNEFPSSMKPVLLAISEHPSLRSLDLSDVTMSKELITEGLSVILEKNKTLVSLQLQSWNDSDLAPLVNAMSSNYSLQSLSIPYLERRLSKLPMEVAQQHYPNYLALVEVVARNQRAREVALMEGAMQTVLGGLAGFGPERVPSDIARYAAQHVAIKGTDKNEAIALSLVNKRAHEKRLEALKRLEEKK